MARLTRPSRRSVALGGAGAVGLLVVVGAALSAVTPGYRDAAPTQAAAPAQLATPAQPATAVRPAAPASPVTPPVDLVTPTPASPPATGWAPLVPGTIWQWQIDGGPIDETVLDGVAGPTMYDVDMETTDAATIARLHAKGSVVVCYLETGGWESYRADAGSYPAEVLGNPVDGYPDERWVDIRRIDVLTPIIAARLDAAAAKGCDGIEPDLDDSYTQDTGFPLTAADQLAFNTAMVELAHARGMSMGLKNGPGIAAQMAPVADWALTESCHRYEECAGYAAFVERGKAVFSVEFTAEGMTLDAFCPAAVAAGFDGLLKESSETLHARPWQPCPRG